MKYAGIGSISHGTMRNEDLLPDFAWELDYLVKHQPRSYKRSAARKIIRETNRIIASGDYDSEDAHYVMEELFEALNEFAPPYCYFGAHEGDGSDYGFWPSLDGFDGLKVDDIAEIPRGHVGDVLIVNDHGNCTLGYMTRGGKFKSVWACV